MRRIWRWSAGLSLLVAGLFFVVDTAFLCSNLLKIADGGWLPLTIGACLFFVMSTWRSGVDCVHDSLEQAGDPSEQFIAELAAGKIPRVAGTGIFLTKSSRRIPPLMVYHVQHMGSLHEHVVALTVEFKETPRMAVADRCHAERICDGIWHATVRFGFLEIPDLRRALARLRELDPAVDTEGGIYFAARDLIVRKSGHGRLSHWRLPVFAFLYRNAVKVVDRFHLPSRNVVEVARKIEV